MATTADGGPDAEEPEEEYHAPDIGLSDLLEKEEDDRVRFR